MKTERARMRPLLLLSPVEYCRIALRLTLLRQGVLVTAFLLLCCATCVNLSLRHLFRMWRMHATADCSVAAPSLLRHCHVAAEGATGYH